MPTLKEEWIERIKKVERKDIFLERGGRFTVMTDFYLAPDEIRYDKEMCFKVLLEADECMWNIPEEIKTKQFLTELLEKGYKGNILLAHRNWAEEDFSFLKDYLSKFDKKKKPPFHDWMTFSPSGILKNREMILSLVKDNEFKDAKFLLKYYNKDKEMMFALLDNHPNNIRDMLKSIKNAYFKNTENIFKVLDAHVNNYIHLPEKFQILEEVIDFALAKDNNLFHEIPTQIIDNRDKAFALIKKHNNIKADNLWSRYKDDYEIAEYMIDKNGSNFPYFNFINDDKLLRLAAKTYNNISYMPSKEEYRDLIREVVLRSGREENARNLSFSRGNGAKAHMVKDLFPELLKEEKIYTRTVTEFFQHSVIINEQTKEKQLNFKVDRQLWIECIKVSPYIYEPFNQEYRNNIDLEILHYYVAASKAIKHHYADLVPETFKEEARNAKIDVDKYIMNEYLSQKYKPLQKVKQPKI